MKILANMRRKDQTLSEIVRNALIEGLNENIKGDGQVVADLRVVSLKIDEDYLTLIKEYANAFYEGNVSELARACVRRYIKKYMDTDFTGVAKVERIKWMLS
ncbi:ribbon-helix-helix domain protein [Sulfolobus filamentous virus 1]|uniref:Ribbon-helix-helix domain protein n=1 Tax=Sulfolobus filamentous virus 1 TaxID=2304198 RepID=A0A346LU65_SUFV1|nr:ribbon-helix-helix domain protein [Sulfolobus filamentous virus 1]AXQ00108.1 ribbon-helix-helix domain protein [Sulfolobus filamentous virus 1]